jgi:tetratricopeptide (TPR) repeat protein
MENLTALVDSLRPGEIQLIQHLYSFKNNPENKKRDRLLRLIVEKEARDEDTALFILYGDKSYSAFSQLKGRLKEDIMNVLLMQDASVKFTAKCAQAGFDCRRTIIQGEILLARGVYQEAIAMLTRASKMARKYELYPEQIQIDDLLRNHLTIKSGEKPFNELSTSILSAIENIDRLQRVKYNHYMIIKPELLKSIGKDFAVVAPQIIKELEEEVQKSDSVKVKFYYHLAAVHYYIHIMSFEEALSHGLQLLQLVETEPTVSTRANLAGAKMELSDIMLHLSRNKEALEYAQQSMEYFKAGMLNELAAMYKMFFAYFQGNNIEAASEILQKALKHKQLKYNEQLSGQWMLLKAAYEFRKGEFSAASKTLKKDNTLARDRSGWLWGYHLLDIMAMFELSDNSGWVDNKIDSVKKIIYRHGEKLADENPRFLCIFRLLQHLVNNGYDFTATAEQERSALDRLVKGEGKYRWNPAGPEIIRFDQWLLSKVKPARKAS